MRPSRNAGNARTDSSKLAQVDLALDDEANVRADPLEVLVAQAARLPLQADDGVRGTLNGMYTEDAPSPELSPSPPPHLNPSPTAMPSPNRPITTHVFPIRHRHHLPLNSTLLLMGSGLSGPSSLPSCSSISLSIFLFQPATYFPAFYQTYWPLLVFSMEPTRCR